MSLSYDLPESHWQKSLRHLRWWVRSAQPKRPVRRRVQGVDLLLPWSHRLPDYAAAVPDYGQNLVRLAVAMGDREAPLAMVDVGANIGDSAVQVAHATDIQVLCVEADDYYIRFLHANVDDNPHIVIERALLASSDEAMAPVRSGGTTRFEPGTSLATAPLITASELRRQHPDFDRVRLVKSDTDGHDVVLIPALAEAWRDRMPVLFFEFDPRLTVTSGNQTNAIWPRLSDLGYSQVAVWDNFGRPIRIMSLAEATEWSAWAEAEQPPKAYWDVAVAHAEDALGQQAISQAFGDGRRG